MVETIIAEFGAAVVDDFVGTELHYAQGIT
jgi:hypothetical protein